MAGPQLAGIKQVPPLQHDKNGEEHRQFVRVDTGHKLEIVEQAKHHHKEQSANEQDATGHGPCDDKGVGIAWSLTHHFTGGRQRRQCPGGERVHNQVHP